MEAAKIPVIVKLTPNVTNFISGARRSARGRQRAFADQYHQFNHRNRSRHFRDVAEHWWKGRPRRICGSRRQTGRAEYACGPGYRRSSPKRASHFRNGRNFHVEDAAEFLLLGAGSLQVCTAVMHYGFRIVEDLCDGLSNWMDEKGFGTIAEFRAKPGAHFRLQRSRPFVSRRGAHRSGEVHQVRSVLCSV